MATKLLVGWILLLSFAANGMDDFDIGVAKKLAFLPDGGVDTSWVTPDLREKLLTRLRAALTDTDPDAYYYAYYGLIALNDEATLQTLADSYHAGQVYGRNTLEDYAQEGALVYLAQDLQKDLHYGPPAGGDYVPPAFAYTSAKMMIAIIARSHMFTAETRKWASKLAHDFRGSYLERRLDAMQIWWMHNESAVVAKQYGRATWLPPAVREAGLDSESSPPTSTTDRISEPPTSATASEVGTRVAQTDSRQSSSSWAAYTTLSVIVACAAGALLFFLLRRRRST